MRSWIRSATSAAAGVLALCGHSGGGWELEHISSDIVLESGSVLESDSSTYFEDSWLGLKPQDSVGLEVFRNCTEHALYELELIICISSVTGIQCIGTCCLISVLLFLIICLDCEWQLFDTLSDLDAWTRTQTRTRAHWTRTKWTRLHHCIYPVQCTPSH